MTPLFSDISIDPTSATLIAGAITTSAGILGGAIVKVASMVIAFQERRELAADNERKRLVEAADSAADRYDEIVKDIVDGALHPQRDKHGIQ